MEIRTHVRLLHSDKKIPYISVTISDTGIGISEDYLNRIFEPFTQEGTDARSVSGNRSGNEYCKSISLNRWEEVLKFSVSREKEALCYHTSFERAQELRHKVIEKTERESYSRYKKFFSQR